MKRAFIHGFLGDLSVWDGIAQPHDIRVPLPTTGASWTESVAIVANQVTGCDVVIGYSLGARIALGLVATTLLPRAVLISVNPGLALEEDRAQRREADAVWAHKFRTEPLGRVLDAWEQQPLFATQARVDPERLAERRSRRMMLDADAQARSLEVMGLGAMPDYRFAVNPERCTLVVGADDAKFRALAKGLPAPLSIVEDSGHDPLLEQPELLAMVLASIA
jgi:2-succinyl-6-hydroxy-2,4-cyclohexadiene-1-carboxylate synthase